MHCLVIGTTESGKTFLSKLIAAQLKAKGKPVAVLDPFQDPEWECDFITSDGPEYLNYVMRAKDHFLFVDETGMSIGRYDQEMMFLATSARHLGHSSTFVGHRFTSIPTLIRTNTSRAYLFATDLDSAKMMAIEYREPRLVQIANLQKGEFLMIDRFAQEGKTDRIRRGRIDFAKRAVYTMPLDDSPEDETDENQDSAAGSINSGSVDGA